MSPEQAQAFLLFAFVAAVTPGPSNVMLTATGANAGVLRGLPCLFGVSVGMGAMMFAVAFGLGALILGVPVIADALKWCGAAFLLWLSWKIASAPVGGPQTKGRAVGFVEAALFQWLNPKSWLVSTSAAGTYLQPGGDALTQAFLIAGLFVTAALPSGFVWLAAGVAMQRFLDSPRRMRIFNVVMGVTLAASVAWILW